MAQPWLAQDLVWMLGSLCQINRIPFDPALIVQQFPPPHSAATFVEAATALGFKVGQCDTGVHPISGQIFPLVAMFRALEKTPEQSAEVVATEPALAAGTEPAPAGLALVVRADGERLLYFRAQSNTAETIPVAEFSQRFESVVLLVAHQTRTRAPDDDLWSRGSDRFGFRWFIPELLKHKTIWRDVLISSLVLQLVGLTTPLFTQVIIDKVVVHQTESTLLVIGSGLVMFLILNAFLTWLRQYFGLTGFLCQVH